MSNVKRFGASGDGTTDDTEAVRHALEAGDGMLHFPPGSYGNLVTMNSVGPTIDSPLEFDAAAGVEAQANVIQ